MADKIIQIDTVDVYNKLYGWETLHPLVTVVRHGGVPHDEWVSQRSDTSRTRSSTSRSSTSWTAN